VFDILILVVGITGVLVRSTGMFAPQGCLLDFSDDGPAYDLALSRVKARPSL
jgi:hypothetical protein